MPIVFQHNQSAHCENGTASNLLNYYGLKLSEPMIFGIGSGLLFFYFPWLKVNQAPAGIASIGGSPAAHKDVL